LQVIDESERIPCKMKPQKNIKDPQFDLFEIELTRIVDLSHPLSKLAAQMNWSEFDEYFDPHFSDEGRPAIETRLMVSLHYLKYAYDLSDEDTVARWVENPYWQHFSGRQHFEHKFPIDPSSMTRWRKRVGADGAEKLLEQTITTALKQGYLKRTQCQKVSVDTTVQTKDIRFPTDARLYDRMREKLVEAAEAENIKLRQNYRRVGKKILRSQQNYAHARQGRRAGKQTKKLKTILGRVVRDIERKADNPSEKLKSLLPLAKRLLEQRRDSKYKIYSIHEPQVECIAKGKAHQRYEFGCKVGVVLSHKGNWILGAQALEGNPYDGHTLSGSLQQAQKLSGIAIQKAVCDQGYKGHGIKDIEVSLVPRKKRKSKRSLQEFWKRRNAIEPIIGHSKSDHRLERNKLAGEAGDQFNAVLSACGFNIKKLMRAFWPWIQKALDKFYEFSFQRTLILKF